MPRDADPYGQKHGLHVWQIAAKTPPPLLSFATILCQSYFSLSIRILPGETQAPGRETGMTFTGVH